MQDLKQIYDFMWANFGQDGQNRGQTCRAPDGMELGIGISIHDRIFSDLGRNGKEQYFTQVAPELCPDGHPLYWDPQGMNQALAARTGLAGWPLDVKLEYTEADMIDYVEGLYLIVSKPSKSWSHPFCGESHPTDFDVTAGRYDYTVAVNTLFRKMAPGYSMEYGKVRVVGSTILDARLIGDLQFRGDEHLKKLITMAILGVATAVSNTSTIRHHEVGKTQITDDKDLLEIEIESASKVEAEHWQ